MADDERPFLTLAYRRVFQTQDPGLAQVSFNVAVLDKYLGASGYSLIRTDTVGQLKREGGWKLDFGIAPDERTIHASLQDLLHVLPEGERDHWAQQVVAPPMSQRFLQMRLSPGSCIDDGEVRPWERSAKAALRLERAHVKELIAHALEEDPVECCGIIAGQDGRAVKLYRARNAAESPYRFEVHTDDLFRIHRELDQNDWEMLAIYHSHTGSDAYPSPTDIQFAVHNPGAHYLIVSLEDMANPVLRAFHIRDGQVTEEQLEVE